MEGSTPHFAIPAIHDNPRGWGPTEESIPRKFKEIPFAPFSKGDKLGKVADGFCTQMQNKYTKGPLPQQNFGTGGNTAFNFYYNEGEEDGEKFQLVDTRNPVKKSKYRTFRRVNFREKKLQRRRGETLPQNKPNFGRHHEQQRKHQAAKWQRWGRNRYGPRRNDRDKIARESSVDIGSDWTVLAQFDFSQLAKLRADAIPQPEDITFCGTLDYYDKNWDRMTVRTKKPLRRIEKTAFKVTTTDDPVIKRLTLQEGFEGNIFATDALLTMLMTCPRSSYSWDIVVRRVGSRLLFFDKRDKSNFDYLTVNETATEPPRDDDKEIINTPAKLSLEASYINQNFSQQVLQPNASKTLDEPNPFQGSLPKDEVASVGFRYRKFDLGDGNVLVCRCEVEAVSQEKDGDEYISVKALNEYDPKVTGVDWRHKLDSQRGAVLATELKNNSNKLARWTAQAMLAGTQQLKLGYVSRTSPKDPYNHQILGVQTYKPTEFAAQINLSEANMWGIVQEIVETCLELEQGNYILVKDPNKGLARLYQAPDDAFDAPEEDEDELADEDEEDVDEDTEGTDSLRSSYGGDSLRSSYAGDSLRSSYADSLRSSLAGPGADDASD